MTAPNLYVKNQGVEAEIRRIWEAWCRKYPRDAANYIAQVVEARQRMWVPSGMSKEGHFAYTGKIPWILKWLFEKKWPGFWGDPKNMIMAQRIFMGEDNLPRARKLIHIVEKKHKKYED